MAFSKLKEWKNIPDRDRFHM